MLVNDLKALGEEVKDKDFSHKFLRCLFGSTQYTSIGGNKYGFVIVDDYTRYTFVFFLVDKSDVFATFKSSVKGIHNGFETTIKRVRSDNGSEFKNTRIDELCDEFEIRH